MSKTLIAGEDLKLTPVPDPVPQPLTGEVVAKLAGADDPKQFVVIQWLGNGKLETLRPDEKARPEGDADQRFIVFRGASTYLFEVDEHRLEWGAPRIRGDVIKKLAGVDPNQYGVWQQSNQGDDKPIENDMYADLKEDGLEVFSRRRRRAPKGLPDDKPAAPLSQVPH